MKIPNILNIPHAVCTNIRGIFCDIDDTITTQGKLLDCSFQALWKAYNNGLKVVPVTGRPAGWCDHIARMWPVHGVIGENGAFYFYMHQGKMQRYFIQSKEIREKNREKLGYISKIILNNIPEVAISADQLYRESDLAVDFCEDVSPVSREKILQVVQIFEEHGCQAKISSIHVNGWFGDFNKLSTCKIFLQNMWQQHTEMSEYIFCGDSPNDEPMFASFPYSVGMANVQPWLTVMKHPPKYITTYEGGTGFAECVDTILKYR